MSFYANLGSLKLNSASSKLHLSASAHITLSSSNTAVTQGRWLSLDLLKSSWVHRGQGLEMTIDITFEGQSLQQHSWGLGFRAASVAAVLGAKVRVHRPSYHRSIFNPRLVLAATWTRCRNKTQR